MKTIEMSWLIGLGVAMMTAGAVRAQQMLPTDIEAAQLEDAIAQTAGEYDQMNLSYIHSLGMQQKAWNDPMSHMGEGQIKPGYSRYNWTPDVVLPIRLREGMMTLINLPEWELIEKVHIGSPESFGGEIAAPNSLLLYADPSYIGVDCNMIVFGRSGNRYVFYLRSETYNTNKITQSVVDVLVGQRFTPVSAGGTLGSTNGASVSMASVNASGFVQTPGWAGKGGIVAGGAQNPQGGLNTATTGPKDWLASIPSDPESFRFDIDMYLPNPSDIDIAPDNVWRDNIFTYIDLGPKALTMTQRPVVNLIVEDSEVPVGFRTRGPNSRLIVVEGIGDMVLRNGKKLICLKLRRDPTTGLEWTDYSADSARPERWHTAQLPPDTVGGAVANGSVGGGVANGSVNGAGNMNADVDLLLARKQTAMTMEGEPIVPPERMFGEQGMPVDVGCAPDVMDNSEDYCDDGLPQDAFATVMNGQADVSANMNTIPPAVLNSQKAGSGIADVMGNMSVVSAQKKKNRQVTANVQETIAIELGSNANISELENIWEQVYAKNEDLLKGYEPYYSVDTTADSDVRELFRLRLGPMKDVKTGDTLCRKLGRRGFSCSVIRIQ